MSNHKCGAENSQDEQWIEPVYCRTIKGLAIVYCLRGRALYSLIDDSLLLVPQFEDSFGQVDVTCGPGCDALGRVLKCRLVNENG